MKKPIISIIILSIIILSLAAPAVAAAKPQEETRVIVGFKDFPGQGLIRANGWKVNYEYKNIPAVACSLPAQAIEALKNNPNVAYVEEDVVVTVSDPDAEMVASWGVMKIGADTVQANGNQGEGIKVAVIDTGINYLHEDLQTNYKGGYDFANKDSDPMDDNGHGSHCAGIIAAADNDIAVVGVAPKASLYALKVLNSAGSGYTSDIIAAIQWATTNGIQVISMSLGSSVGSTSLQQACDNAFLNYNIVVVAAAGNNGVARTGTNILYPARYANVIAVGATDKNNVRASFSCTGPELDLMAPGVSILSDYIDVTPSDGMNRDVLYMSGTSMACPHVAGTAALVLKSDETAWTAFCYTDGMNGWSAAEVSKVLTATADDLGAAGKDNYYGYGIVDADEAALPSTTPPPPPPPPTETEKTYAPTKVTLTRGTVTSGSYTSLAANDGIDLAVKSARVSSYQTIDWYSSTTIAEEKPKVTALTVTYDGSYSRTQTQILYVYNWAAGKWDQTNSQSIGTTDKTVTLTSLNPVNYISTGGEIRLRTYATLRTSAAFTCNADFVEFKITYTS